MSKDAIVGLLIFGSALLFFLLLGLAAAVSVWWKSRQEARRAERATALMKDLLDRGRPVEEIERLLRALGTEAAGSPSAEKTNGNALEEFAGYLATCEAPPEVVEEVTAMVRAADQATQQAMVRVVQGIDEQIKENDDTAFINEKQIRAAVRALARPAEPSKPAKIPVEDVPPLTRTASRITESFHIPE